MDTDTGTTWQCLPFSDLSLIGLYEILRLRNEVFIVEQNCPYPDCDGKDLAAYHLTGTKNGTLVAYTRLLAPGISYPDAASIGRVLTCHTVRNQNLGKQLMTRSIENVYRLFGRQAIRIGAQFYLKRFYESFGFTQEGNIYLEDGIEHITMAKFPEPGKEMQ